MSPIFCIPVDIAVMTTVTDDLGTVATANQWARAAIVAAWVEVGSHGGARSKFGSDLADGKMTPKAFAALGIHGLRSAGTVIIYWRVWQLAVDNWRALPVAPGDQVELPDLDWHEYYHAVADGDDDDDDPVPECAPVIFSQRTDQTLVTHLRYAARNAIAALENADGTAESKPALEVIADARVILDAVEHLLRGESLGDEPQLVALIGMYTETR
jgi:hypothetical protein